VYNVHRKVRSLFLLIILLEAQVECWVSKPSLVWVGIWLSELTQKTFVLSALCSLIIIFLSTF
jgi:hypothetical protein